MCTELPGVHGEADNFMVGNFPAQGKTWPDTAQNYPNDCGFGFMLNVSC